MAADWARFCHAPDLVVDSPHVNVELKDGRRHCVTIEEGAEDYVLRAFVAKQSTVASISDLPLTIWIRNRAVSLVGFRIDRQGRLIGEAWVHKEGLTAAEFQIYVRTLAVEADRFEYLLTGRDAE